MPTTYHELLEKLKRWPEIDLLEKLDISSEEIVDRFGDLIEIKYDSLVIDVEDDEDFFQEQIDE
jgi:hypothetical protein